MTTFTKEPFVDVIEEMKPMFERHWQELARNQEMIKLDPDYERYLAVDKLGILRMFMAREDGKIIGYAVYFVSPHMHYRNDTWAVSDILWVSPEKRRGRVGIDLLRFVETSLREEGVSVMHTTGKEAHPALATVLDHLGHARIEFGFAKVLK